MFDPVVFENLKVAFENICYDLDNLDNRIVIVDRKDIIDMAIMSRKWSLTYELTESATVCPLRAEIILQSSVLDLSNEILERENTNPSCSLLLRFICSIEQPYEACPQIDQLISSIWGSHYIASQQLRALFGSGTKQVEAVKEWIPQYCENVIELPFDRKINEEQMGDLDALVEHTIKTLEALKPLVL